MNVLTQKFAGIPAWSYGAIAAIGIAAIAAFRRAPSPSSPATTSPGDAGVPGLVVVATPQEVTPYDLPVTRIGSPTSSELSGDARQWTGPHGIDQRNG